MIQILLIELHCYKCLDFTVDSRRPIESSPGPGPPPMLEPAPAPQKACLVTASLIENITSRRIRWTVRRASIEHGRRGPRAKSSSSAGAAPAIGLWRTPLVVPQQSALQSNCLPVAVVESATAIGLFCESARSSQSRWLPHRPQVASQGRQSQEFPNCAGTTPQASPQSQYSARMFSDRRRAFLPTAPDGCCC